MRYALIKDFEQLFLVDLHGNYDKREKCPDGSKDENVFDITQGVAISILGRKTPSKAGTNARVYLNDVWGLREFKYSWLVGHSYRPDENFRIQPAEEFYFFKHGQVRDDEYQSWWQLNAIFQINGNGVITAHDHFSIAFDDDEMNERLDTYVDRHLTDNQVLERLGLKENSMWKIHEARASLRRTRSQKRLVDILYRPFDIRRTFFHKSVVFNLRLPVMRHMVGGGNVALICSRMTKGESFAHAFVSRTISEAILLSSKTSNNAFSFPINLRNDVTEAQLFRASDDSFRSNLSPQFLNDLSAKLPLVKGEIESPNATDVCHYIYALLHSLGYRSRYAEFLKIDFPRLPLTGNLELFRALAKLGGELVALHLLESPKLDKPRTEFIGGRNPEVEKIRYTKNTVWVDKAQAHGFRGVPEEVWNFHIGGYQVCEKWLKDRKGRTLLKDDIAHYHKIIIALAETIRLMSEIDKVIDEHGGWPGAFAVKTESKEE
jgi:predicted helicase